jgi:CheY-like chemotaxis protein
MQYVYIHININIWATEPLRETVMRILICEDSEQNLQSAREFAEKVKGEHEVTIVSVRPARGLNGVRSGEFDVVLTDLYMELSPESPDGIQPFGLFAALGALQYNVPVAIVTDGKDHGDDPMIKRLDGFRSCNNARLQVHFVHPEKNYPAMKGVTPDGKAIKDWEFCFRALTATAAPV